MTAVPLVQKVNIRHLQSRSRAGLPIHLYLNPDPDCLYLIGSSPVSHQRG